MALMNCRFFSEALGMSTTMTVIVPQTTYTQIGMKGQARDGKHPTLYLLHGLSDDDSIWLRRTSIERYAADYGLAVVMPNVHKSFYTDMVYGDNYWTFLSEELPAVARSFFPLSAAREDNYVAGLSMGGYGAFKWALRQPERFAAAASLSGAVDMAARLRKAEDWTRHTMELVYGGRDIQGTPDDLVWLVGEAAKAEGPKPSLFQTCGTEDFLYEDNLVFRDTALASGYGDYAYHEAPGEHNWAYWDEHIQTVLKRFFGAVG